MKNKGFTLVEMLAAIVIIAILSAIVIVNFTSIFSSTQKKVYETYEDSMKDATIEYIIDSGNVPKKNQPVKVSLAYLVGDSKLVNESDCNGGSSCTPVPKGAPPYLDHFKNPNKSTDKCVKDSYVVAYLKTSTTNDGKVDNNKDILYSVCLKCSDSGTYESTACTKGCIVTFNSNGTMSLKGC